MKMPTDQRRDRPKVQVQIVTYNSADSIEACICSVLSQTLAIDSILVIDNNSKDETVLLVREFPGVTVICCPVNLGYAGGHNIGFARAAGSGVDYVVTLNPDVRMERGYLECLVDKMLSTNLGGITGKLVRPCGVLDSAGLEMQGLFHVRDRGSEQPDGPRYAVSEGVWGICGAAAMYRMAMLETIRLPNGMFLDESFFVYKEDVDLCWRARHRGWNFQYEPTAVATHRRTWSRHSRMADRVVAHSYANQVALLLRHVDAFSLELFAAVAVELVRFFLLMIRRPKAGFQSLRLITK
ncbi:glycosyltransferase family 2 protein, partial [Alicyclobacillus acidiphilus]|uniref:glycosyltransferase family 2 protein n=1 Tax=Alicyclobacillus acidiphilus TaxID=182455 RepID=UPI000829E8C2